MLDTLSELQTALDEWSELTTERAGLQVLLGHLKRHDPHELQEDCVLVSNRGRRHALYIFEHVYSEDHDRDSAMVSLLEEYRRYDFELDDGELPDYLSVLLEFLPHVPSADAQELLGGTVHVIVHITEDLQSYNSSYATMLKAAAALSPVTP